MFWLESLFWHPSPLTNISLVPLPTLFSVINLNTDWYSVCLSISCFVTTYYNISFHSKWEQVPPSAATTIPLATNRSSLKWALPRSHMPPSRKSLQRLQSHRDTKNSKEMTPGFRVRRVISSRMKRGFIMEKCLRGYQMGLADCSVLMGHFTKDNSLMELPIHRKGCTYTLMGAIILGRLETIKQKEKEPLRLS